MNENQEYIETLKRAFVNNPNSNITIDGWTNEYLRNAAQYAIDQGWLKSELIEEHQYSYYIMNLTNKGKVYFKLFQK